MGRWKSEFHEELLAKRQILFQESMEAAVQERISSSLLLLNARDPVVPITFFVDSSGGKMLCGSYLVDAIRSSKAPVHGVAMGQVDSMAFDIYQACHVRFSYEHALFLFHGSSPTTLRVDQDDFDEKIAELRALDRKALEVLAKRSGQPFEKLQAWSKAERRFTAREAKDLGFVDDLIESPALVSR